MDFASFLDAAQTIQLPDVASFDHFSELKGRAVDGTSTVLIGCGCWSPSTGSQEDTQLLLQNKGAGLRFGRSFTSVTKMLADPLNGYLESWAAWPSEPVDLQRFVASLRLVGEDGNPDSIFGLLLMLARVARVSSSEFPAEWIEAVDDWERTGTAEKPFRSWCSLESSLAHSMMYAHELNGSSTYTNAWQQGLLFAVDSLKAGHHPLRLPASPKSAYHARAYAALEQDEQQYHDWLQRAPIVQLSLPVADMPGRYRLVDTLMIEESQLTGAAKNFYRNDVVNSPLKAGFTLSIIYRPLSTESNPDVTITVDHRRRVSLLELWEKLEDAETAAWLTEKEERPSNAIRSLEGVTSRFNEPWFINPDRTLIGSPRKIAGSFAGRLSWREIQDLILRECNPLKKVMVMYGDDPVPVPILSLAPGRRHNASVSDHQTEKTVLIVSWPSESEKRGVFLPRSLPQAPTVRQLLATLIQPRTTVGQIGIFDLAAQSTFDQVHLTGGFAIVSDRGVFVLDDWTKEKLEHQELRAAFKDAASLHAKLVTLLGSTLPNFTKEVNALLARSSQGTRIGALLKRLSLLSLEVAQLRACTCKPSAHSNARLLKEAMDHRWSLERRLTALETELKTLDTALRSLVESRVASITRFIGIYGFALFIASGLAAPLAKTVYYFIMANHPTSDPPGWWVLVGYALVAALLILGLLAWARWIDPLRLAFANLVHRYDNDRYRGILYRHTPLLQEPPEDLVCGFLRTSHSAWTLDRRGSIAEDKKGATQD